MRKTQILLPIVGIGLAVVVLQVLPRNISAPAADSLNVPFKTDKSPHSKSTKVL
jgi:hypothetical protein